MAESLTDDWRVEFIRASTWHGTADRADAILAAHPELASSDIHIAAILGDDAGVRGHLARDPGCVNGRSDPYGADPLTHLCLSKYLRLDPARTDAFLRAATALLDAGADPNAGFWTAGDHPEHETPLYGAAGVAHHAPLTRLLLERGADPNDGEAVYHSPETDDNAALSLLVETGRVTAENLCLMLDPEARLARSRRRRVLLDHGADANGSGRTRGWRPLHHALARSNGLAIIDLLLDRGADPALTDDGLSAVARSAREGRGDVLASIARRGLSIALQGVDRLVAALRDGRRGHGASRRQAGTRAREGGDRDGRRPAREVHRQRQHSRRPATARSRGRRRPLRSRKATATSTSRQAVSPFTSPPGALSRQSWSCSWSEARPPMRPIRKGRTPLALAIKACVDLYWTYRRTPESVDALLRAGASIHGAGVRFPSGYAEVDDLLRRYGA